MIAWCLTPVVEVAEIYSIEVVQEAALELPRGHLVAGLTALGKPNWNVRIGVVEDGLIRRIASVTVECNDVNIITSAGHDVQWVLHVIP